MAHVLASFIYLTFDLWTLIEGDDIDDDGNLDLDTVLGRHDNLADAQAFCASLPNETRVLAFINDGTPLHTLNGLGVTFAKAPPVIYDESLLPTLKETLGLYPDLPSSFDHVDESVLPLCGFCGDRMVSISRERRGYVRRIRHR